MLPTLAFSVANRYMWFKAMGTVPAVGRGDVDEEGERARIETRIGLGFSEVHSSYEKDQIFSFWLLRSPMPLTSAVHISLDFSVPVMTQLCRASRYTPPTS